MSESKTRRAIEIQESIRQVLFHEWDPIGVKGYSNAVDEYDSCIAPVYRILAGNRSEDELLDFLYATERDTLGASCKNREQLRPVARKLLTISVRF